MKRDVIVKAMDHLDEDLIMEALPSNQVIETGNRTRLRTMEKYMAIAACLIIMVSAAPIAMRISRMGKAEEAAVTGAGMENGMAETPREAASAEEAAPEAIGEENDTAQMVNPLSWYSSLAEINEAVGCDIHQVQLTEVEDVSYMTIAGDPMIAQYEFVLNNALYTIRAGETEADISGIYLEKGMLSELIPAKDGQAYEADGYSAAIWFDGSMQYCVYSEGVSAEELEQVLQAMR